MDEQKRLILAIVLSVAVLVGYQILFVKPPDPNQQAAAPAPSPSQIVETESSPSVTDFKTPAPALPQPQIPAAESQNYRTIRVSTPLYTIAISEQGAVVKSMELKNYRETNKPDSALKQLVPPELASAGALSLDFARQPGLKQALFVSQTQENDVTLTTGEKRLSSSVRAVRGLW